MNNHPHRSRAPKFYATTDCDHDTTISGSAHIAKFNTRAEAEAYLAEPFAGNLEPGQTVEVQAGRFSDCWIKSHRAPKIGDKMIEPFSFTDISILRPGQHPGGNLYWIEPTREVLVAVVVQAKEAE